MVELCWPWMIDSDDESRMFPRFITPIRVGWRSGDLFLFLMYVRHFSAFRGNSQWQYGGFSGRQFQTLICTVKMDKVTFKPLAVWLGLGKVNSNREDIIEEYLSPYWPIVTWCNKGYSELYVTKECRVRVQVVSLHVLKVTGGSYDLHAFKRSGWKKINKHKHWC